MPRDTRQWKPGWIFIPSKKYQVSWKITITDNDSVVHDVTDYVISMNIVKQSHTLNTARVTLSNPKGFFLNKFSGGEELDIYIEYDDVDPTTKIYVGKLDNIRFSIGGNGYTAEITSRTAPELKDKKIVISFVNALVSDAIKQIIDDNYDGLITYNNVVTTTERITASYNHQSGIDVIYDVLKRTNQKMYIDTNYDMHTFEKGTEVNINEQVNYNTNLISLTGYGVENTQIFNRIWVYGKIDGNIVLLDTQEDTDSQNQLWIKDEVITDSNLVTMEEVEDKAVSQLTNRIIANNSATLVTLGMPGIEAGQSLSVYVPYCGAFDEHMIAGITHNISGGGFTSNMNIEDKPTSILDLMKERIVVEEQLKPYENQNSMTGAYTVFFDEDPTKLTHNNTEEIESDGDGLLQLQSGQTSGVATANVIDTEDDVTQCEFRIKANDEQQLCTYEVSNDGGNNWDTVEPGYQNIHTFTTAGHLLMWRINMVGDVTHNPKFTSISVLYK